MFLGGRDYFSTEDLPSSAATEVKFRSPVCLPPLTKNFGVWRSQWRVFRLLKQKIAVGKGGQAKKRSLELAIELSVVDLTPPPAPPDGVHSALPFCVYMAPPGALRMDGRYVWVRPPCFAICYL